MPPISTGIGEGWKDQDWDKLLINIEAGTVIPILGRDLLQIAPDDATPPVPLYRFIAARLVEDLVRQIPALPAGDPNAYTLNDAVCLCMRYGRNQFDICYSVLEVLKEVSAWPVPTSLRQLAEITDFPLFVSTTFDPLLESALKSVTVNGENRQPLVLAYDPKPPSGKAVEDLPVSSRKSASQPFVYHLMGRLALSSSNIVVSDEDLLEFVAALYSENKKRVPINLLNEFSRNHLLLLGCSFSDWLARFFLRAAKRRRLSAKPDDERLRNIVEYVVDDYAHQEKNLVLFLEQFWTSTRIFRSGNVLEFVRELHRRWGERNPAKLAEAAARATDGAEAGVQLPATMPDGAIFISYAREDVTAAERLHSKLKGMSVWFDQAKLEVGDAWERKIDESIARCRFFMPIISRTTDRRLEGFFRREWNQAAERTRSMHDDTRFIVPVVIDETKAGTARVPKAFLRAHWWTLPEGKPTPEFVRAMRALVGHANGGS